MKRIVPALLGIFLCAAIAYASQEVGTTKEEIPFPDVPRISQQQCKKMMGMKGIHHILLDVRPNEQWKISPQQLPGAIHENPFEVKSWAHKYDKEATLVLY